MNKSKRKREKHVGKQAGEEYILSINFDTSNDIDDDIDGPASNDSNQLGHFHSLISLPRTFLLLTFGFGFFPMLEARCLAVEEKIDRCCCCCCC